MYALHVTYTSAVPAGALREEKTAFAAQLAAVPGFVSKAWLHDGSTGGGFYLFDSREHGEAFACGPLIEALRAVPVFSDVQVHGYDVDAELSALTGIAAAPVGS
jgi:hypothetical protein